MIVACVRVDLGLPIGPEASEIFWTSAAVKSSHKCVLFPGPSRPQRLATYRTHAASVASTRLEASTMASLASAPMHGFWVFAFASLSRFEATTPRGRSAAHLRCAWHSGTPFVDEIAARLAPTSPCW